MTYDKDIKKIVREKNRLRKIKSKVGIALLEDCHHSTASIMAQDLIQHAIEKLHEAEIVLRRKD
jgi:hypothetical protein